jgi:hypothetical protein
MWVAVSSSPPPFVLQIDEDKKRKIKDGRLQSRPLVIADQTPLDKDPLSKGISEDPSQPV